MKKRVEPIAAGTIDEIVAGGKYYIQTRKAPNLNYAEKWKCYGQNFPAY